MKKLGRLLTATLVATALTSGAQAVDYWTGGAGIEAREQAPEYNTAIEFFVQSGSYLSEIWVSLYDANGNVMLETMTEGPWFIADLDDGQYSVKGLRLSTGEVQSARFQVSGDRQHLVGLRYQNN
ncbi:MAG: hypothetical protein WED11_09895 [Natronospirillum sp.]